MGLALHLLPRWRGAVLLAAILSLWVIHPAETQGAKLRRVGWISTSTEETNLKNLEVVRAAFADLGWREGQNLALDMVYAEGRTERGPELANELLQLGAEVLVAGGYEFAAGALQVTQTVPVVGLGCGIERLSASLARPSGNLTGVSCQSFDLDAKHLQLLSEVLAGERRIAVLYNPTAPDAESSIEALKSAAAGLDIVAQPVAARQREELEPAFAEIGRLGARGAVIRTGVMVWAERRRVVALAAAHRVAIIASFREFSDLGALLSYGSNIHDLIRITVATVDKILKGAKVGDLPIQQPTRFELVVNMKTARTLGLTIPNSILLRADALID
jgi:putative tryptophan/tyrosine transport system substrate-binding protein